MVTPSAGSVVLVPFPFSDLSRSKLRPAVVLDDYSEPQPDVTLLRVREDFYAQAHPTPADVLLIVEVADTSVEIDRDIKLPLYARAGIPQVLPANLPADFIESYSGPADGAYRNVRRFGRGETVEIESVPGLVFPVDAILG